MAVDQSGLLAKQNFLNHLKNDILHRREVKRFNGELCAVLYVDA